MLDDVWNLVNDINRAAVEVQSSELLGDDDHNVNLRTCVATIATLLNTTKEKVVKAEEKAAKEAKEAEQREAATWAAPPPGGFGPPPEGFEYAWTGDTEAGIITPTKDNNLASHGANGADLSSAYRFRPRKKAQDD